MRRGAIAAALVALAAIPPAGLAAGPVRLTAAFDRTAPLGSSSAMRVELRIDPRRARSPVTELRLLYPDGLGLISSGLGLASCRLLPSDFQRVLIGARGLGGCSPNAVLGYGSARAEVRLLAGQVIPESASLTLLIGPIADGRIELVAYVDGEHPFGAKLAYAGEIEAPSGRYGGGLVFHIPAIPAIADLATVALVRLRLTVGSRAITYYEHPRRRTGAYHPDGVTLPLRCPRRGFPFRARLTFADGGHATTTATARCPRPGVSSATARGARSASARRRTARSAR
jgi:hypothetical protein